MGAPIDPIPKGVDITVPSAARVYDYYLGGACNFAADRAMAKKVAAAIPWVNDTARENRQFLRRAVRFFVDQGIRQFLDIGSGTPTVGNVHEVAQEMDPSCRVVYVDNEHVAVAHSQLILEGNDTASVIKADLREPKAIFEAEETRRLIDFDQPVGVLMVALLHFISNSEDPMGLIDRYRDALAPGSFLALSHVTEDAFPERIRQLIDVYQGSSNPVTSRGFTEIEGLLHGFELVDPGVVWTAEWRPECPEQVPETPESCAIYAAVGQKP